MSNINKTITLEDFEDTFDLQAPSITIGPLDTSSVGTISTIDLSNISLTSSSATAGYTISGAGLSSGVWNSPNTWTTTGTGTSYNWSGSPATKIDQGGKITLQGEGADIDIDGKSLKNWMEKVEERLNILTPNPELEKEWDDLRKLGERYRKLEKKCKEKAEVWKKLKDMPPPKLD